MGDLSPSLVTVQVSTSVPPLRIEPTINKFLCQVTSSLSLFQMEKNFSQIFKKQQRNMLHKAIQVPPPLTQPGNVMGSHYCNKLLSSMPPRFSLYLHIPPFRTKETVLQILYRTILTENKKFKSGMTFYASDVKKPRQWSTSCMGAKITPPKHTALQDDH